LGLRMLGVTGRWVADWPCRQLGSEELFVGSLEGWRWSQCWCGTVRDPRCPWDVDECRAVRRADGDLMVG
jgi:hypothetical protein